MGILVRRTLSALIRRFVPLAPPAGPAPAAPRAAVAYVPPPQPFGGGNIGAADIGQLPARVVKAGVHFDPDQPYVVTASGLVLQKAVVDVLLADNRMTRLGVLAYFDPATGDPVRMSYVALEELVESEVVA